MMLQSKLSEAIRPVCIFLALLGVAGCVPLLYEVGRNALLRAGGEPLAVIVTQNRLTFDASTNFTFYRGRVKRDTLRKNEIELAIVDPNWATSVKPPTPTPASTASERAQQAVNAVMAKINASPLPVPATAPRFVRDDMPPKLVNTLYPGKQLIAKRSGSTLILADEYEQRLPAHQLPLFTLAAGLIALAGLLYFLLGRGKKPIANSHAE